MTQIKPIGMRCNQEQFNAITPKLEQVGFKINLEFSPTCFPYLVNNYSGRTKEIACVQSHTVHDSEYNRTVFEKWNEQTFLEYCGIVSKEPRMVTTADIGAKVIRGRDWKWGGQDRGSVYGVIVLHKRSGWVRVEWKDKNNSVIDENSYRIGTNGCYDLYYYEEQSNQYEEQSNQPEFVLPEKWAVAITEGNREVLLDWVRKQFKYNGEYETVFVTGAYALSKHPVDASYLWSGHITGLLDRDCEYKLITFGQFQQHVLKQSIETMKKYTNYTVNATELFKIHKVACSTWKSRILDYLKRTDAQQQVTFTEEEIDGMFSAATANQEIVLVEIFGKAKPTYTPKPGEMVWCWDRTNTLIKVGIYRQCDGSDMPHRVGDSWWHCVAPFNGGVLPEGWAAKFREQQSEIGK